jgi:hypothetical protein
MDKVFSSEVIASTDLHAGGHLFGILFRKRLRFQNDGVVYLEKYVVDDFNPMDKLDVSHLNSFKITGRWEKSDSVKIKCVFESIFLEMTGIVSPKNNARLIFHCYDSRLSKQWGEIYSEKKVV